jgi:HTH-type transcriptional regulator/antitoxin HipB
MQVRETRVSLGLTQVDVAGLSNTGVRFVVDLENGKSTISLGKLVNVLVTLGLTLRVAEIQAIRHNAVAPRTR